MSMAGSTPAQKPRGPASRISAIADFIRPASPEIVRHSGHADVRIPAAVGRGGVAVGVVLVAVAGVERGRVGDEDRSADAGPEEERKVGGDLLHLEVGPAGRPRELRVRHEAPERQEVVAEDRREARPERRLRVRVPLIEGLDADLERAAQRAVATEALGGQYRRADPWLEGIAVSL